MALNRLGSAPVVLMGPHLPMIEVKSRGYRGPDPAAVTLSIFLAVAAAVRRRGKGAPRKPKAAVTMAPPSRAPPAARAARPPPPPSRGSKATYEAAKRASKKPVAAAASSQDAVPKERPFEHLQLRFVKPLSSGAAPGSVFSGAQSSKGSRLNLEMLNLVVEKRGPSKSTWTRPQESGEALLPSMRLQRIHLFFAKAKMSPEELCDRVRWLHPHPTLSLEMLELLKEVLLTSTEKMLLQKYEDSPDQIRHSEQVLLPMLALEPWHVRMMCFDRSLDSTSHITTQCTTISAAGREILNSHPLMELMSLVLEVGNFLNGCDGTAAAVDAFAFESLQELLKLKVNAKKNINALHIVALNMDVKPKVFFETLRTVPEASGVTLAAIDGELSSLNSDLELARRKFDSLRDEVSKEKEQKMLAARERAELFSLEGEDYDAPAKAARRAPLQGDDGAVVSAVQGHALNTIQEDHQVSVLEGLKVSCLDGDEAATTFRESIPEASSVRTTESLFSTPRPLLTPRPLVWPSEDEVSRGELKQQELYLERLQELVERGKAQEAALLETREEMRQTLAKVVYFLEPSRAQATEAQERTEDNEDEEEGEEPLSPRLQLLPVPEASSVGAGCTSPKRDKGRGHCGPSSAAAKSARRQANVVSPRHPGVHGTPRRHGKHDCPEFPLPGLVVSPRAHATPRTTFTPRRAALLAVATPRSLATPRKAQLLTVATPSPRKGPSAMPRALFTPITPRLRTVQPKRKVPVTPETMQRAEALLILLASFLVQLEKAWEEAQLLGFAGVVEEDELGVPEEETRLDLDPGLQVTPRSSSKTCKALETDLEESRRSGHEEEVPAEGPPAFTMIVVPAHREYWDYDSSVPLGRRTAEAEDLGREGLPTCPPKTNAWSLAGNRRAESKDTASSIDQRNLPQAKRDFLRTMDSVAQKPVQSRSSK